MSHTVCLPSMHDLFKGRVNIYTHVGYEHSCILTPADYDMRDTLNYTSNYNHSWNELLG